MITVTQTGANINHAVCEFHGLSTDIKPIDIFTDPETSATTYIDNGSIFYEIDTGKRYMYDSTNQQWHETQSGSSGGGGSNSDFAESIELNYDSETGKNYFPTDKLDILRLHKPFMYDDRIWYCLEDNANYSLTYFTINDSHYFQYSSLAYLLILDETKEVIIDNCYPIEKEEDLSAATLNNVSLGNEDFACCEYYLDKSISYLSLTITATGSVSSGSTVITFDNGGLVQWNSIDSTVFGIKSNGTIVTVNCATINGFLTSIETPALTSGQSIKVSAQSICTQQDVRPLLY